MPIDPLHGRRVPSGRRLASAISGVLRSMRPTVAAAIARNQIPDLSPFYPILIREILPLVLHEHHLGRVQMVRELRNGNLAGVRRGKSFRTGSDKAPSGFGTRRQAHYPTSRPFGNGLSSIRPERTAADPPSRAIGHLPVTKIGLPRLLRSSLDFLRDAVPRAVQALVLALAGSVIDGTQQAIRERLEDGLRAGQSNVAIASSMSDLFSPRRAMTIAQTEASRSMHAGEEEVARESGADGLQWLASSDACPVCRSLNGKRVKFGSPFVVLASGNPEYRTVYHPPGHVNCHCTAVPFWA